MNRFENAISKGIRQAREALARKQEIQHVFDELASAVTKAFDERVELTLEEYSEEVDVNEGFNRHPAFSSILDKYERKETRYFTAIVVANRDPEKTEETILGEWAIHEEGYPVSLKYSGARVSCDNKDELEEALEEFLSRTSIIEKIQSVCEQ